jgi:hypothetical protein
MTFGSCISLLLILVMLGNMCYEIGVTVGRDKQRKMCDCCCGDDEDEEGKNEK